MRLAHLTMHGIGTPARPLEDGEEHTWVTVEQFEALLDAVADQAHVSLAFDDANISDVEIALPRLRERGLTASFFVLAGLLGEQGRLDAADVRDLHRAGMTIGSHGWAHRNWRDVASAPSGPDAREELALAPQLLSRLIGADVTQVAVPFGQYDRHVLRELRLAGVSRVFTSDSGWARASAWVQPRNSIHADSDLGWAQRVVSSPPPLPRRVRTTAARTIKSVRGSGRPTPATLR